WKSPGQPRALAFSPSGRVVAVGDNSDYKVRVFSVNASTGGLAQVPGSPFAGVHGGVVGLAFSPSGEFLAAAGQVAPNLSVSSVDRSSGALGQMAGSPF